MPKDAFFSINVWISVCVYVTLDTMLRDDKVRSDCVYICRSYIHIYTYTYTYIYICICTYRYIDTHAELPDDMENSFCRRYTKAYIQTEAIM